MADRRAVRRPELAPNDLGYYYDPEVEAGLHGQVRLSRAIEQKCACGGQPPYMVFSAEDAEPVWCPCRRYRLRIKAVCRHIAESGIPAPFQYRFLGDFRTALGKSRLPAAEKLKMHLQALVDRCRNQSSIKGFYLWGNPGVGKTFFAYVALNELIFNTARPGKFISLSKQFFQVLRFALEEASPMHGRSESFLTTLYSVPFLVIDDFGVQRNTEWELEMLYNLIDTRYSHQRFTIITTNQDIERTKALAEGRLHSRLAEMCHLIHVTGPDHRTSDLRVHEA